MNLFQILSCSDVGTCCSNYAMVGVLDIGRKLVNLIQLFAPLVLMGTSIFQLVKMIINPDDKKGLKSISNKLIAAVIIFFIPIVFDISIGILPDNFSFSACWNTAKSMNEVSKASKMKYIALSEKRASNEFVYNGEYEKEREFTSVSVGEDAGDDRLLLRERTEIVGQLVEFDLGRLLSHCGCHSADEHQGSKYNLLHISSVFINFAAKIRN